MTNSELITYIKELKKPSKQQQLLIALSDKGELAKGEAGKLEALLKSEQAALKAATARAKVAGLLRTEAQAAKAAERKDRNHRLIEQGILIDLAGLEGRDRGAILGGLLDMKAASAEVWDAWKRSGDTLLAEK